MSNPARQFDSLAYSNKLRKAGVSEEQANIQAEAFLSVIEGQLLNKADLEKVELKLSAEIEKLDAKLSSDIKDVKSDVERVEAKLSADIKDVRRDVKESELRLFVRLIGAMVLVGGILKYLPAIHF